MKITKNIFFKNFKDKFSSQRNNRIKLILRKIDNEIINSLKPNYKYSFSKKIINRYKKKFLTLRLIGMGGSILGAKAIFSFLKKKVRKKVTFFDN